MTAVAGTANAAKVIDLLERENLFLVPLDYERPVVPVPSPVPQMLRSQLARTEPEILPELHRRATAWLQAEGSTEEAIRHALAGGDTRVAVQLIAAYWYAFVFAGRTGDGARLDPVLGDDRIAPTGCGARRGLDRRPAGNRIRYAAGCRSSKPDSMTARFRTGCGRCGSRRR